MGALRASFGRGPRRGIRRWLPEPRPDLSADLEGRGVDDVGEEDDGGAGWEHFARRLGAALVEEFVDGCQSRGLISRPILRAVESTMSAKRMTAVPDGSTSRVVWARPSSRNSSMAARAAA